MSARSIHDTPILAKTIVRYVGEPIVAIAADSPAIAVAAAQLVDVDYEPLTPDHHAGRGAASRMRRGFTRTETSPPICKRRVATLKQHWLQPIS